MTIIKDILKTVSLFEDLGVYNLVSEEKLSYYTKNILIQNKESQLTENTIINKSNNILHSKKTNKDTNKTIENTSNNIQLLPKKDVILSNISKKLLEAKTLPEVKEILLNYNECSLKKTATNTVFGVGNENANLLLIGEAPGADEDLQGEPFVGRSGKLLTKALEVSGIKRENIFITNAVFWRPPGNRTPTTDEVLMCKPFINRIIQIIKPRIILLVGKVSANMVLEEEIAISKLRGKWYNKSFGIGTEENMHKALIKVVYHPAYLLRNPRQKKTFWFDIIDIILKLKELELEI